MGMSGLRMVTTTIMRLLQVIQAVTPELTPLHNMLQGAQEQLFAGQPY